MRGNNFKFAHFNITSKYQKPQCEDLLFLITSKAKYHGTQKH